ncbi:hypothetical protein SESBI_21432 [Sesbania bispinosa]|nr:hypothetical protein SESBI_21432 [Sesbania bispinosa]
MNMNFPDIRTGRSPRKELQGLRPSPLRINKDSHKIKKPPLAPSQPQGPPRQPVIIYTVSPKIIHTTPSDFMSLVQRLTGSSSSSVSTDSLNGNNGHGTTSSTIIEEDRIPQMMKRHQGGNTDDVRGVEEVERPNMSLIPSSFFSPSSLDPSLVSFLHELSPVLHGNRNFMEGSFVMSSPSNFVSPRAPSIDLFNNFSN